MCLRWNSRVGEAHSARRVRRLNWSKRLTLVGALLLVPGQVWAQNSNNNVDVQCTSVGTVKTFYLCQDGVIVAA